MSKEFSPKTKSKNPFSTSCNNLSSIVIENITAAPAVTKTVKCILIGDPGIGKSSLVRSFISSNGLSPKYAPTAWEDYSGKYEVKTINQKTICFK
jgi:GTPase SAR1 family protein